MSIAAESHNPHDLYEQRCGTCHEPHGGEFASKYLRQVDSRVIGRQTGKQLRTILASGHGKLSPDEADVMVLHLTSILNRGAVFREKCLNCHDRAALLARKQLILHNGKLVGRYSGRDIATFLEYHGRLKKGDMSTVLQMLEAQLNTQREPLNR